MLRASTAALSRTITALRLKEVTLFLNQGHVVSSSPDAHQHHIINSSPDVNRFIVCSNLHSSQINNIDYPTSHAESGARTVVYGKDILKSAGVKTSVDGMLEENVTLGKKMVSCRRIVQERTSPIIGDKSKQLVDCDQDISMKSAGVTTSVNGMVEKNVALGKKMVSCRRIVQERISPIIRDKPEHLVVCVQDISVKSAVDEKPEQLVETQEEATENLDGDILWRNFEASRAYMHGTAVGRGLYSI